MEGNSKTIFSLFLFDLFLQVYAWSSKVKGHCGLAELKQLVIIPVSLDWSTYVRIITPHSGWDISTLQAWFPH